MDQGASGSDFKIRFTIAGASITEHPTYAVFKQAATILNDIDLGWDIEVKADSQALTKLATGSLAVWAAAWGSTLDPDMYQVYHKDSTATSVLAWGYREIKAASDRDAEMTIITDLSKIIDAARETMNQNERKPLYKQALMKVCELAVEMPAYQRKTLYAYNAKAIQGFAAAEDVNPYSSPLDKIWELELVK
jgi:peptide/nickel transport system substrate-binding protein